MSYGPAPWAQTQWDARAAANFMCGGAGGGLVFVGATLAAAGAPAGVWLACALLGMALVGAGLTAVWFEIGRPLRALNVMFNPRTSWMTRESIVATLLFASTFALVLTRSTIVAAISALLALAFVFAQGRILRASKGIPAWHDASVPPLIVASALAEGGGLALAIAVLARAGIPAWVVVAFGLVLIVRVALWFAYRRRVRSSLAPRASSALDSGGRALLFAGALAPLILLLASGAPWLSAGVLQDVALVVAGLLAWAGGWAVKFVLVCRASFNRGFSLPHLPVRGRS